MAKPVSVTISEDGMLYVVNDDGSVFNKRPEIGTWDELEPVPGTPRDREVSEEEGSVSSVA